MRAAQVYGAATRPGPVDVLVDVAGGRVEVLERALRYSRRDGLLTGGDAVVEGRLLAAIAVVLAVL